MVVPAPTEPKVRPLISWSFWKGYHLAAAGIPLIAHVEVVDIAVLQVEVALYITGQVKVVVDRRRYLAELRAVDTAAIAQSDLVLFIELIGSVGRGEEVAVGMPSELNTSRMMTSVTMTARNTVITS